MRFFPLFLRTSRVMVQYAHRRGLDAIVAAVHPKHARLYRRYFDFRVMGEQKKYPSVRNRPALALWAEFARLDRECFPSYRALLDDPLGEEELEPHPMSVAECNYFRPMIDPSFQCGPIGDAVDESRAHPNEVTACVA